MPAYGLQINQDELKDVVCPSGTVQIRQLGVEDLIALDILDQMDAIGGIVQTDHVQRVKGSKKPSDRPAKKPTKAEKAKMDEEADRNAFMKIMKDKEGFSTLRITMDRVVAFVLVQPKVELAMSSEMVMEDGVPTGKVIWRPHTPAEKAGRDQTLIWTDQLDMVDKMTIFGAAMPGQDKMATFREKSTETVGDLVDESKSGEPAE